VSVIARVIRLRWLRIREEGIIVPPGIGLAASSPASYDASLGNAVRLSAAV